MSKTAVLVIDMLNPYDHSGAERLAENVAEIIDPLRDLIGRARDSDADLIYVNDNHDDFTATSKDLGKKAMDGDHPELVEPILPPKGALFVQKVRHSAFYNSALDHLLRINEIERLVLTGQVTEQCVLYTALDAYLRGFDVCAASDCVAAIDPDLGEAALKMMEHNMHAEILPGAEVLAGS